MYPLVFFATAVSPESQESSSEVPPHPWIEKIRGWYRRGGVRVG